ncbi:hypothetical protein GTA08_BOTSDO14200 [Botryosphaeria dothidea]|uniref:Uncharacterized protein n=1 Tax=Botryosphaeria dothidea TaxID=55169 RepID=A0A8H4MZC2_9PEZI|nr:hypothetical protein GTA08_BOTSDO14200 [Botryosphaeria dothidea]
MRKRQAATGAHAGGSRVARPVLHHQPGVIGEVRFIVRDEDSIDAHRMGGNHPVERVSPTVANGSPQRAEGLRGRNVRKATPNALNQRLQNALVPRPGLLAHFKSGTQLGIGHDRHDRVALAQRFEPRNHLWRRLLHEVDADIRIEHPRHDLDALPGNTGSAPVPLQLLVEFAPFGHEIRTEHRKDLAHTGKALALRRPQYQRIPHPLDLHLFRHPGNGQFLRNAHSERVATFEDTGAAGRAGRPKSAARPAQTIPVGIAGPPERPSVPLFGDTEVNQVRARILSHVRGEAARDPGLFSLTVPTGGGKTLASLAFALDHALHHGLQRVIFVIPFTSIVEQNAAVFRRALGELGDAAVLEHHSAFVVPEPSRADAERYQSQAKLKLAMENWDAPHHRHDRSAVLRKQRSHPRRSPDAAAEAAAPRPSPAIDELARNYRSSVVLCTATQPALNAPEFNGGLERVRELAPEPHDLFRALERVRVRHVGELADEALAAQDAQVLANVREDLRSGLPCRLVSTSLIEAGVDVDFPLVLRAEAGLDSIAQAAGRCNREGLRDAAASEVRVFSNANADWAPPPELKQFAQAAATVLRTMRTTLSALRPSKPISATLLAEGRLDSLPLETLATRFRMIDSVQMPVIVPYDDTAREALRDLRFAERSGSIARRLQPYLVQLPRQGFEALRKSGAIQPVATDRWGEQFMALTVMDFYDPQFGLSWDDPAFIKAESLCW